MSDARSIRTLPRRSRVSCSAQPRLQEARARLPFSALRIFRAADLEVEQVPVSAPLFDNRDEPVLDHSDIMPAQVTRDARQPTRARASRRPRKLLAGVTMAALALVATTFVLRPSAGPTNDPAPSASTTTPGRTLSTTPPTTRAAPVAEALPDVAAAPSANASVAESAGAAAPEALSMPTSDRSSDAHTPREARPAQLEVTVTAWGHIWLDGTYLGADRQDRTGLRPGTHRIGIGESREAPSRIYTVRLRAGPNELVYPLN